MGVYIKGMVMPYGCANCPFMMELYDVEGREIYICSVPVEEVRGKGTIAEELDLHEGAADTFPDWCPLVEVPEPHGRLINEDDVYAAIHERLRVLQTHQEFIKKHGDIDLAGVLPYISNIPTVIEAEGE